MPDRVMKMRKPHKEKFTKADEHRINPAKRKIKTRFCDFVALRTLTPPSCSHTYSLAVAV